MTPGAPPERPPVAPAPAPSPARVAPPAAPVAAPDRPADARTIAERFLAGLKDRITQGDSQRQDFMRVELRRMTHEQLQELDRQVRALAAVPDRFREVFKNDAERDLVLRLTTERLGDLRREVESRRPPRLRENFQNLTTADAIKMGGVAVVGGYLLWKALKFIRRPFRTTRNFVGNAIRHPIRTVAKTALIGVAGVAAMFFGAKYIERFLQRAGVRKIDAAHDAARPLGGVAAGTAVVDARPGSGVDTRTLTSPAAGGSTETISRDLLGTPAAAADARPPEERITDLRRRLAEAREGRGAFSLADAYRLQAQLELQLADRLNDMPDKRAEADACRLRATYCEMYANAIAQYGDLHVRYERVKALAQASGVTLRPEDQRADDAIQAQFRLVADAARRRMAAGFGATGDPAQMASTEAELWNLLKGPMGADGRPDINQGLPVFEASITLLQQRYHRLLDAANGRVPPEATNADLVLTDKNRQLVAWLKANGYQRLGEQLENRNVALSHSTDADARDTLPNGYSLSLVPAIPANPRELFYRTRETPNLKLTEGGMVDLFTRVFGDANAYAQYRTLTDTLRTREEGINAFKRDGEQNVNALVDLQQSMAAYQAGRMRLSVLRSRFTPGAPGGALPSVWTATPDQLKAEYDRFFLENQRDSADRYGAHLNMVERNVLRVGSTERLEDFWNKNGRVWMTRLADTITDLQTFWMPTSIPGTETLGLDPRNPRQMAKERLMGELPQLLGWPRYKAGDTRSDGRPLVVGDLKEWKDFTPDEQAAIRAKQTSVLDHIKKFRDAGTETGLGGHFDNMKKSIALMKDMSSDANKTQVQTWLAATPPDATVPATLAGVHVTSIAEIPAIARANGCSEGIVVMHCAEQLISDTDKYHESYRELLKGIHNVIGVHMDWELAFDNFINTQGEFMLGMLAAIGITFYTLNQIGARGRLANSGAVRFGSRTLGRLPGGGVAKHVVFRPLNGARRVITYPFTRAILGPTPVPGAPVPPPVPGGTPPAGPRPPAATPDGRAPVTPEDPRTLPPRQARAVENIRTLRATPEGARALDDLLAAEARVASLSGSGAPRGELLRAMEAENIARARAMEELLVHIRKPADPSTVRGMFVGVDGKLTPAGNRLLLAHNTGGDTPIARLRAKTDILKALSLSDDEIAACMRAGIAGDATTASTRVPGGVDAPGGAPRPAGGPDAPTRAPGTPDAPGGTARPLPGATGAPDALAPGTRPGAAPELSVPRGLNNINAITDLNTRNTIIRLVNENKLSVRAANQIAASPSAQRIFLQGRNIGEVMEAARAANRASLLSRSFAGIGLAADAFGAYMAYANYMELEKKIENTQNPALQDLYRGMQQREIAMGTVSVVGLVINGAVFVTGAGGLLAVASVAMLPTAILLAGVAYASSRLNEVAETWSKDHRDWARELGPTGLLQKLYELSPGSDDFWQIAGTIGAQAMDSAAGMDQFQGDTRDFYQRAREKQENGNEAARAALLQAYFMHTIGAPIAQEGDTEQILQKRQDVMISDAMRYMLARARMNVTGPDMENALTHARLCDRARALRKAQAAARAAGGPVPTDTIMIGAAGSETEFDLANYDTGTTLFANVTTKPQAGAVIAAYRNAQNQDYAMFLNATRPSYTNPAEGARLTRANAEFAQRTLQNELLTRLEPYLYRCRSQIDEYVETRFGDVYQRTGKKQDLEFIIFQQIRFRMAGGIQQMLQRQQPVTAEDVEGLFRELTGILQPIGDWRTRFDQLLSDGRRMNHATAGDLYGRGPMQPAMLRANLITNTGSREFQQFVLEHPWLVSTELISTDMRSTQSVVMRVADDKMYRLSRGMSWYPTRPDLDFVMNYANMLDRNQDYDLDGSVRAAIRGLNNPAFQWDNNPNYFDRSRDTSYGPARTTAYQNVLRAIIRNGENLSRHYHYFNPVARGAEGTRFEHLIGRERSPFLIDDASDKFVTVNGAAGEGTRITAAECGGSGREIRDAAGKLLGRLIFAAPNSWTFDTAQSEAEGTVYVYGKGDFNGRAYEKPGTEIRVRAPRRLNTPLQADNSITIDSSFFGGETPEQARFAHRYVRHLRIAITLEDGRVINAIPGAGWHREEGTGRQIGDAVLYNADTRQPLEGFTAEYLTTTTTGRPALKITPAAGTRIRRYDVTFGLATLTARRDEAPVTAADRPGAAPALPVHSRLRDDKLVMSVTDMAGGRTDARVETVLSNTELTLRLDDGTIVVGRIVANTVPGTTPPRINTLFQVSSVREPGQEPKPFTESRLAAFGPDFLNVGIVRLSAGGGVGFSIEPKPNTVRVSYYEVSVPSTGYRITAGREQPRAEMRPPVNLTLRPDGTLVVPAYTIGRVERGYDLPTLSRTQIAFTMQNGDVISGRLNFATERSGTDIRWRVTMEDMRVLVGGVETPIASTPYAGMQPVAAIDTINLTDAANATGIRIRPNAALPLARYTLTNEFTGSTINALAIARTERRLAARETAFFHAPGDTCVVVLNPRGPNPQRITLQRGQPVPAELNGQIDARFTETPPPPATAAGWLLQAGSSTIEEVDVLYSGNRQDTLKFGAAPGTTPEAPRENTISIAAEGGFYRIPSDRITVTVPTPAGNVTALLDSARGVPPALAALLNCEYVDDPDQPSRKIWMIRPGADSVNRFDVRRGTILDHVNVTHPAAAPVERDTTGFQIIRVPRSDMIRDTFQFQPLDIAVTRRDGTVVSGRVEPNRPIPPAFNGLLRITDYEQAGRHRWEIREELDAMAQIREITVVRADRRYKYVTDRP